ncbi:4-coumarate--CoA ligase 1 [Diachasma alloeum]|uniref:4-coumarate--CoA ligase 1 n=1 Tax=Diachasma alloeum TaxID=454923 RepID=UPI0007383807|nr:4-coumarate--CoA ligase 1 [Diachasma alloeum]XP_015127348.1 4-coumarate--CoA ligase 1 [Diachasma alloeum]XP_015127349.1 4-coumarate--CoA ligase 1 [Diachasma alloeum]XP_015127350.1 4-coumarate--CoA ligase 1 [Diachasma alloeum]XP_028982642.1 4-coumarate--CoA ligase 1 [Diachasma alloeum]
MESIIRGCQRMGLVLKNGTGIANVTVRRASVAAKLKIIEGNNGERIFTSPFGDIDLPSATLPEFIWENVNKWPTRIALECSVTGRKYTYAEARDSANYVARSLRNMGLRHGDVVALILPNLPETPIALLGAVESGLIVTSVNPIYTPDEIARQVRLSGAKAIITSSDIAPNALAVGKTTLPQNAPIIVVEDGVRPLPEGTISFKDLLTRGKTLPDVPKSSQTPDDVCIMPYSSGTTGLPKGVMLTHRNLVSNCAMSNHSTLLSNDVQDVIPGVLPLCHIYGLNNMMHSRLVCGAHIITLPSFTSENFINVLTKHQCTFLFCVPSILLFIAASPMIKREHFKSLRGIISGAAPISESDIERVYNQFGIDHQTVPFLQGYGLTECTGVGFLQSSNSKYASIGHPIANSETRLVDPITGQDVQTPGQSGEIWLRGPHVMKGYYQNEKATNEMLQDGWLKTGDIAYFDDEFTFFIVDRLKELIKVKGFQVPPAELEGILRTHADIADAAVVGVPDERYGEVPKAFVVLKKDHTTTAENIHNFVKGKVSEYKQLLGGIVFINEIPRNASGKILRIHLKNLHHDE